jgi:hypothetical protein
VPTGEVPTVFTAKSTAIPQHARVSAEFSDAEPTTPPRRRSSQPIAIRRFSWGTAPTVERASAGERTSPRDGHARDVMCDGYRVIFVVRQSLRGPVHGC